MSEPELKQNHVALVSVVALAGLAIVLVVLIVTAKYDRIDLWPLAAMVGAICVLGLGVAYLVAKTRD